MASAPISNLPSATDAATAPISKLHFVKRKIDEHAPYISAPAGKTHAYFTGKKTVHSSGDLKEVQKNCSLRSRKFNPVIEFLKILQPDKKRALFGIHESLLENLKKTLENKILHLSEPALLKMLGATCYYLQFDELKSIPMEVMRCLRGNIPNRQLQLLSGELRHRLQELPLSVRRQVWDQKPEIFVDSIRELCSTCHTVQKDNKIQESAVRTICDYIGNSELLFEAFANHCSLQSIQSRLTGYGLLLRLVHVRVAESVDKSKTTRLCDLTLVLDRILKTGLDDSSMEEIVKIFKALISKQNLSGEFLGSHVSVSKLSGPIQLNTTTQNPKLRIPKSKPLKSKAIQSLKGSKNRGTSKGRGMNIDSDEEDKFMEYGSSESDADVAADVDSDSDTATAKASVRKRRRVSDADDTSRTKPKAKRAFKEKNAIETIDCSSIFALEVVIIPPVTDVENISNETVQDIYEDAITFVKAMDPFGFFAIPVSEEIAPGYFSVIKEPMDLSTIEAKSGSAYRCFEELSDDVELMLKNCIEYNYEGSDLHEVSKFILKKWEMKRDVVLSFIETIGEPLQDFFPARSDYILWRTQHPERLEKVDFEQLPVVAELKPIIPVATRRPKRQLPITQVEEVSVIPVERDSSASSAISVEREPSTGNTEEILNRVYKVVEYIKGLDLNSMFLEPVNEEYAPQYYSIITHPMDLQTILRKGEASMYASIQEVCDDVDLMLRNCLLYNNPDDWVYKTGSYIESKWKRWKKGLLSFTTATRRVKVNSMATVSNWHTHDNPRLFKVIKDAFTWIKNRDDGLVFHNPVDVQGYLDVIKEPMDLSTIEQKMIGYSSVEDLNRDVELMLNNCKAFNKVGFYFDYAVRLSKEWRQRFNGFQQREIDVLVLDDDAYDKKVKSYAAPSANRIRRVAAVRAEENFNMSSDDESVVAPPDALQSDDDEPAPPPRVIQSDSEGSIAVDEDSEAESVSSPSRRSVIAIPKIKILLTKDETTSSAPPVEAAAVHGSQTLKLKFNLKSTQGLTDNEDLDANFADDKISFEALLTSSKEENVLDVVEHERSSTSFLAKSISGEKTLESPAQSSVVMEVESKNDQVTDVSAITVDEKSSNMDIEKVIGDSVSTQPLVLKIESIKKALVAATVKEPSSTKNDILENLVSSRDPQALVASGRTLWASVMLRDPSPQKSLRLFLARRLEKIITNEDKLPSEDSSFVSAYNLFQLSLDLNCKVDIRNVFHVNLPVPDMFFIRRILPAVLFQFLLNPDSKQRQKKSYFEILITKNLSDLPHPSTDQGSVSIDSRTSLLAELLASWSSFRCR